MSSEEEMQMQSSFRIIKSQEIERDSNLSLVETKIDLPDLDLFLDDEEEDEIYDGDLEEGQDEEEGQGHENIDIDKIKEDIKKQLYKEIAYEKNLILKQAKEEADKIRIEARDQGYKDGMKKGIVDGYAKGKEEADKDSQAIKENAFKMVKQAEEYVEEYYDENKDRIIRLAGDIAESIVHQTIDTSSENLLILIKPLVQQYRNKKQIIITAHPENTNFLKNNIDKLRDDNEDTNFVIIEDKTLEKNGSTIENENQIIDLQIGKQIKNILNDMKNME